MARHGVLVRVPNEHTMGTFPSDIPKIGEVHVIAQPDRTEPSVSDHRFLKQLIKSGLVLSETAIDLYILAVGCYIADQRIPRKKYGEDSWSRRIDLFVPVSDPTLWKQQSDQIGKLLNFLSGDYWSVHFRGRDVLPPFRFRGQPEQAPNTNCVSLFSGGLDSFIGAINLLEAGMRPVFVGQYSSSDVITAQKKCADALKGHYADQMKIFHAFTRVKKTMLRGAPEPTMRSRSFLFLAIGTLIASSLVTPATLYVPENGFISLNLPLSLHRLGSLSTKTTHPYLMNSFQTLVNQLQLPVSIHNPFQFKTKGQMVAECANQDLLRVNVADTMSCSHPTQARFIPDHPSKCHCGTCVPCLIRRASIFHAWGEDNTFYATHDCNSLAEFARQARNDRNANVIDLITVSHWNHTLSIGTAFKSVLKFSATCSLAC
jgi:7-cyano-7-deazaguanine synthase in queuosine biosynthesis